MENEISMKWIDGKKSLVDTLLIVGQAPELNLGAGIERVPGRRLLANLGQGLFLRSQVYSFQPGITNKKYQ